MDSLGLLARTSAGAGSHTESQAGSQQKTTQPKPGSACSLTRNISQNGITKSAHNDILQENEMQENITERIAGNRPYGASDAILNTPRKQGITL
jgi:GH35 family endo-1,4-beta-xylanase